MYNMYIMYCNTCMYYNKIQYVLYYINNYNVQYYLLYSQFNKLNRIYVSIFNKFNRIQIQ